MASVLVAVVMVRLGASGTGSTDGETLAGALVGLAAGGLLGARVWKSASRKHSG
ncbi:hypothetical protein [Streptomyces sp. BRB081]|uniref:hypothetical protein n=1 Tax=Streptomyces sp. BRB081 TaxID=2769544 RepID=UPI001F5C94D6|nr:hypothetical protein [Streptomyces sp. BRB081]